LGLRQEIYCAFTKKRFGEAVNFKHLRKSKSFVFVLPCSLSGAIDCLPGLAGLVKERRGIQVRLLIPDTQESLFKMLDHHSIEKVFYRPPIKLFNKTFQSLRKRFTTAVFDVLADLNSVPNRAMAYLVRARYRLGLRVGRMFPYYNLDLATGNSNQVFALWSVTERSAECLFPLDSEHKKLLAGTLGKKYKPLLFVNGRKVDYHADEIRNRWPGSAVVLSSKHPSAGAGWLAIGEGDERILPLLQMSEAYLGPDDDLGHLARAFFRRVL